MSPIVKEIIENSLDAGAKKITVHANELSKFVISDNGSGKDCCEKKERFSSFLKGISKEDFQHLCTPHATSKLSTFEDLQSVSTFGFRGEALASVSQVAFVKVLSRVRDSEVAYEASYVKGEMIGKLKPCGGNYGTTITVENLFYNDKQKKEAYENKAGDELKLIEKMMEKYAIHFFDVSFLFKRDKTSTPLVSTPGDVNSTQTSVIGMLYQNFCEQNLLQLSLSMPDLGIRVDGYVTNGKYKAPKACWIFFVNHRLVDASEFQKGLKAAYALAFENKKMRPFVYMSVIVDPKNVDVNVDPSKSKVRIYKDVEAAQMLKDRVLEMLRTWIAETKAIEQRLHSELIARKEKNSPVSSQGSQSKAKKAKVTVEKVYAPEPQLPESLEKHALSEVNAVLEQFSKSCNAEKSALFHKHFYVGAISPRHSTIQCDNMLYCVDHVEICRILAFQHVLSNIQKMETCKLTPSVKLHDAVLYGLMSKREGYDPSVDAPIEEVVDGIVGVLCDDYEEYFTAKFLKENFGIEIDPLEKTLIALPRIPFTSFQDSVNIPSLLIALAYDGNFTFTPDEKSSMSQDEQLEEYNKNRTTLLIKGCAQVVSHKWMVPDHCHFAPKPVPVDRTSDTPVDGMLKSASVLECFAKASELGSSYLVWQKVKGVSSVYFVQHPKHLFESVQKVAELDRCYECVVHGGRKTKFFGYMTLHLLIEKERKAYMQRVKKQVAQVWSKSSAEDISQGKKPISTHFFS